MSELVAIDIGGTNARFTLAHVERNAITLTGAPVILKVADHPSLEAAWTHFAGLIERPLPKAASLAVASPVGKAEIKLTNSDWVLRPAELEQTFELDRLLVINDFSAMAHAAARLPADQFRHVAGPDRPLPDSGAISVLGPGTGLGVGQLIRLANRYHVIDTEGGHGEFAPVDAVEDGIVRWLRSRHGRVSMERVVSGPGLINIHAALAAMTAKDIAPRDDIALWQAAMDGSDPLAREALDRFCKCFGSVTGTIALIQGASAVVLAGGVAQRLAEYLPHSGFAERFCAKGRFSEMMADIPIRLITHAEPGLFGAAAAFAAEAP